MKRKKRFYLLGESSTEIEQTISFVGVFVLVPLFVVLMML